MKCPNVIKQNTFSNLEASKIGRKEKSKLVFLYIISILRLHYIHSEKKKSLELKCKQTILTQLS